MRALTGTARRWEPRRLRLRLFSAAGRPRPRQPPPAAQTRRTMALGRRDHRRRHSPAGPPVRLTSQNHPDGTEGAIPGPWNPAHPTRQPGSRAWPAPENHHQPDSSGQRGRHAKDRGKGSLVTGMSSAANVSDVFNAPGVNIVRRAVAKTKTDFCCPACVPRRAGEPCGYRAVG
jgi:hypothetical protein